MKRVLINKRSLNIRDMTFLLLFLISIFVMVGCTSHAPISPKVIESHKECPLCGMYPARYPLFNCQLIFEDHTYEAFDSAEGLLIYLLFPDKTDHKAKPYHQIYFKDYLNERWVDAKNTYFVVGSEILGPMGIEFVAFSSEKDAQQFLKAEQGKQIVHFNQVDQAFLLNAAQKGWLHFLANKLLTQ